MDSPPPLPLPSVPPMPRSRRITRKLCWVVSLAWLIGWPLAVWALDLNYSTGHAWALTWYPIAMLWLAYWLVAWFFWVAWGAVWEVKPGPAPAPTEPTPEAGTTMEPARS